MGTVLVAWVLGTAAQLLQARLWSPVGYGALALGALVVTVVALVRPWRGKRWVVAVCAAGLAFALTGWRATFKPVLGDGVPEGALVWVRGVVAPGVRDFGLSQRFELELSAWRSDKGAWQPRAGRLRLSWYRVPPDVQLTAGQGWALPVRLRAPHGQRNPGGPDQELRYWRDGVWANGTVAHQMAGAQPQLLAVQGVDWLSRWREATRSRLRHSGVAETTVPWLEAWVLGNQGALSSQDWALLRDTGTAHLVSVSGLHVTVLAGWAYVLMGWVWRAGVAWRPGWGLVAPRTRWCTGAALLVAMFYAAFAGWGVPVQRASLMLVTAGMLRLGARVWPAPVMWLWVAAVVLVWDPWALLQAGFWLSFVAVGLLFLRSRPVGSAWRLRELVGTQAMMTVALAPLSAWWFGQVSVVGVLANVLAIPWVSLVALPLALLGAMVTPVWSLAAWAVSMMVPVLAWLQSWPGAVWSITPVPAPWALLAVVGLGLAFLRGSWSVRLTCLWLVVPALVWRPERPGPGQFWLHGLDVGQGSAVLVRTAHHTLLFDAGPSYGSGGSAGRSIVVPSIRALGADLDALVLSHQDHDHVGGALDVWQAWPHAEVWASFAPPFAPNAHRCVAGQAWSWDGVRFEVLHPFDQAYAPPPPRAGNAQSCVLRISSGGVSALLTGDLEQRQEAALLAQRADWRTNLLVAAHHGSDTSSSLPWLQAVAPDVVWVQAGYRNPFGHPASTVVARWADLGLPVYNTATCGALAWRSDAPERSRCERSEHPRYWAHQPPTGAR